MFAVYYMDTMCIEIYILRSQFQQFTYPKTGGIEQGQNYPML